MSRSDPVPEIPFQLEVNDRALASWTCSPDGLDALAVGWLFVEGYLEPGDAPPSVEVVDCGVDAAGGAGARIARVQLPDTLLRRGDEARRRRAEAGTGPLHFAVDAPKSIQRGEAVDAPPTPDEAAELFRRLYAEAERYRSGGGHHSAALFEGEELRAHAEEVGRHNAVDKVIGRVLLDGRDPAGMGLVLSARVSAEIALKAGRARLGWIASRSVPTTLALRIAAVAGIPILARAAGREPRLFLPDALEPGALEPDTLEPVS